jgi:hypothetical protein
MTTPATSWQKTIGVCGKNKPVRTTIKVVNFNVAREKNTAAYRHKLFTHASFVFRACSRSGRVKIVIPVGEKLGTIISTQIGRPTIVPLFSCKASQRWCAKISNEGKQNL